MSSLSQRKVRANPGKEDQETMAEESTKVILITRMGFDPCLIITADEVLRVEDGIAKPVAQDHLIPWINEAHWLRHALNKDFDPLWVGDEDE